jgi:hypothetical protein
MSSERNRKRNELNNLILTRLIPRFSLGIGSIFMIIWISDVYLQCSNKGSMSIVYPLSIVAMGALSIIGFIVALAVINRRED